MSWISNVIFFAVIGGTLYITYWAAQNVLQQLVTSIQLVDR